MVEAWIGDHGERCRSVIPRPVSMLLSHMPQRMELLFIVLAQAAFALVVVGVGVTGVSTGVAPSGGGWVGVCVVSKKTDGRTLQIVRVESVECAGFQGLLDLEDV